MSTPIVAVGVDNGGTWIRLVGLNQHGRRVWSLKKKSPALEQLPTFLRKELNRFSDTLNYLSVGSKGIWKQQARDDLNQKLKSLAKEILVVSDVEAAWLAAFETNTSGILLIAGTGSIAYGRHRGKEARAGGLGPAKGDEGSGYWIGREWSQRRLKTIQRKSVREVARLTASVIKKAQSKNLLAAAIVQEAQEHLANIVLAAARRLHMRGPIPLSAHGSVLANPWFKNGFIAELRRRKVSLCQVSPPRDVAHFLAKSIISHGSR